MSVEVGRIEMGEKKKTPRWLKVCGIGCGIVVLIIAAIVMAGTYLVQNTWRGFEEADRSVDAVFERHGPTAEFTPDPGGSIRSERLELFLTVREDFSASREELDGTLATLSEHEGGLRRVAAGMNVIPDLVAFHRLRNESLLSRGMGMGEYYYIYTLAYYSWLGRSPADGPSFQVVGDNGYILESAYEERSESEVREHRLQLVRRSMNRLLLPILRNHLSGLSNADSDADLRAMLVSEIAAMEADGRRIPWKDGLPQATESSLLPYRQRLEAAYSGMCNAVEIGVARRLDDAGEQPL
jgi:hypothetical protein